MCIRLSNGLCLTHSTRLIITLFRIRRGQLTDSREVHTLTPRDDELLMRQLFTGRMDGAELALCNYWLAVWSAVVSRLTYTRAVLSLCLSVCLSLAARSIFTNTTSPTCLRCAARRLRLNPFKRQATGSQDASRATAASGQRERTHL